MNTTSEKIATIVPTLWEQLSPRQRQYALLILLVFGGIGLLWLAFALTDEPLPTGGSSSDDPVTNIGVMPPGSQVSALDRWVGIAGSKLAQYEQEREDLNRFNQDRQSFEQSTQQRLADLEQRLTAAPTLAPLDMPLPPPPMELNTALPPTPTAPIPRPAQRRISHIQLASAPQTTKAGPVADAAAATPNDTTSTFLPVSFTRGTLLGGLDAPTGGQAQSNPHPVLIRLADNSVLPNRFRGAYRECFVIAAGYGDISAERAYLRTENLSCVRADGRTLEVKIQGSVYGEDGKVGLRGRLVTKQGQLLANALLSGVVSGIGRGVSAASTDYSTSALGTVGTVSGSNVYRAGIGTGVGQALDRLSQYYIQLAEKTFPIIEVDAGRQIDVVITKGVRIDVPADLPVEGRDDEAY